MEYKYDKATLVPTNVYSETYDEVVADFITHYGCAQYLTTPMPGPIFDIARKRMNLTVYRNQQLSENSDVLGTIAFFDGDIDVYDPGTKSYIGFSVKRATGTICNAYYTTRRSTEARRAYGDSGRISIVLPLLMLRKQTSTGYWLLTMSRNVWLMSL